MINNDTDNLRKCGAIGQTYIDDDIEGITFVNNIIKTSLGGRDAPISQLKGIDVIGKPGVKEINLNKEGEDDKNKKIEITFHREPCNSGRIDGVKTPPIMYVDENSVLTASLTTMTANELLDLHIEALINLGINCERKGNDIEINGRKVGACSGGYRYKDKCYRGVLICLEINAEVANAAVEFETPIDIRAKGINQFINERTKQPLYNITKEQIINKLKEKFTLEPGTIDQARVDEIKTRIYDSEAWLKRKEITDVNDYTDK